MDMIKEILLMSREIEERLLYMQKSELNGQRQQPGMDTVQTRQKYS